MKGKMILLLLLLVQASLYPLFYNLGYSAFALKAPVFIKYTDTSFVIESATFEGNISMSFEWENTGTYIKYNESFKEIKEMKEIAFVNKNFMNKNQSYMIRYWLPRLLYEYEDENGDGLFSGSTNENFTLQGPDKLILGYKIDDIFDMSNVTVRLVGNESVYEWKCQQLIMPMQPNLQGPWERYPTLIEVFHYYPINSTLKMDIILNNFEPKSILSKIYLSYGVQFIKMEPGNFTVAFDNLELSIDKIKSVYPVTSPLIKFRVNGNELAMFNFGGKLLIDSIGGQLNASVGPADIYWLTEPGDWMTIGLNYPHVNNSLIHDPYFGLIISSSSYTPTRYIPGLTLVMTIASTTILILTLHEFRKTRKEAFTRNIYVLSTLTQDSFDAKLNHFAKLPH